MPVVQQNISMFARCKSKREDQRQRAILKCPGQAYSLEMVSRNGPEHSLSVLLLMSRSMMTVALSSVTGEY